MADAEGVNVAERAEQLVCVQFDTEDRKNHLSLGVGSGYSVDGVRNVFQHEVQIALVAPLCEIERVSELYNIGMVEHAHDLQLAVLEPLVLQHLLDRHHLPCSLDCSLEDDAKATSPND